MVMNILPRMRKDSRRSFQKVLRGDAETQTVLADHNSKLVAWRSELIAWASSMQFDVFTAWNVHLAQRGCMTRAELDLSAQTGMHFSFVSFLSPLQARLGFLDAQDPEALVFGRQSASFTTLTASWRWR